MLVTKNQEKVKQTKMLEKARNEINVNCLSLEGQGNPIYEKFKPRYNHKNYKYENTETKMW